MEPTTDTLLFTPYCPRCGQLPILEPAILASDPLSWSCVCGWDVAVSVSGRVKVPVPRKTAKLRKVTT